MDAQGIVKTDTIIPTLYQLKTWYAFIQGAQPNLNVELVTEQRKWLLTTLFQSTKRAADIQKPKYANLNVHPTRAAFIQKNILADQRYLMYGKYLTDSIFFLEQYANLVFPTHITLHTCLIRTSVLNRLVSKTITQTFIVKADVPKIPLLPEQTQAFTDLFVSTSVDINNLFMSKWDKDLNQYAIKISRSQIVQDDPEVLLEYDTMYPKIVCFLDTLYPDLKRLQKAHTERYIAFIKTLGSEICRTYQKEILNTFEDMLINGLGRFSRLALFRWNLEVLLPGKCNTPTAFLDTPIGSYLVMKEFEQAFLDLITPVCSEVMPPQAVLCKPSEIKAPAEIVPSDALASTSDGQKAEAPTVMIHTHTKKAKAKKHTPLPVMPVSQAPLASAPAATPEPATSFTIRIGEKIARIKQKLLDEGLTWDHSTGGHDIYATPTGDKVTLSGHHKHITPGAAKDLEKRVNEVLGNVEHKRTRH